jgi:branched-chain amino acid transport system substrate-binding protein
LQPIHLSCADHEGGGAVRFEQWDGKQFKVISDWVKADRTLLRPIIEESSTKYAKEKGITVRDCDGEARL